MGSQMGSQDLKPAQDTGGFSDPSAAAVPTGSAAFWTIAYYQPLFDVDTVQVLNRVKGSLLPRPRGAFFELIAANPDLYGPFWVATTLIFAMAITGNLASYFAFVQVLLPDGKPDPLAKKWQYDFSQARPSSRLGYALGRPHPRPRAPRSLPPRAASLPAPPQPYLLAAQLTVAGSVIYSYVTLLPLLFWLLLRYYEASKKLADVLCIYGYTMAIFIPVTVLCVLPSNLLRWLLVLLGGGARTLTPRTTTTTPSPAHTTTTPPPHHPPHPAPPSPPPPPRPPPPTPPCSPCTSPAPPRTERGVGAAQPSLPSSSSPTSMRTWPTASPTARATRRRRPTPCSASCSASISSSSSSSRSTSSITAEPRALLPRGGGHGPWEDQDERNTVALRVSSVECRV